MDDVDGIAGRASDLPEPGSPLPVDPAASAQTAQPSAELTASTASSPQPAGSSSQLAASSPPPAAPVPPSAPSADSGGADAAEAGSTPAQKKRSFLRELPLLLAIALVLALVVKSLLVQSFFIPTGSMEDTLRPGDRVLVNKAVFRIRDIKRGEVVVFNGDNSFNGAQPAVEAASDGGLAHALDSVSGWFGLSAQGEKDYIKRVIGLPGDRVSCCDARGRLSVNGVPLDERAYLYPGDRPSIEEFDILVPEDRLWVMGDHRSVSQDSRAHLGQPGGGTVPIDQVVGLAFVIVWPLNHAGTLGIPETFSQPGLSGSGSDRG
jgi:signal peptidase I